MPSTFDIYSNNLVELKASLLSIPKKRRPIDEALHFNDSVRALRDASSVLRELKAQAGEMGLADNDRVAPFEVVALYLDGVAVALDSAGLVQ